VSAKLLTAIWLVLLGLALAPSAQADSTGSWSPVASMTTPRYGAVAAALSDGRVLVAGGIDGSGNATASAEIYDPSTNIWTPTAAMGSARAFAAAAPLSDDQVLVAGGDVDGSPSASAEIYDGTSGTWSPAAPMEYARAQGTATMMPDGTVWVTGGAEDTPTETYDPASNLWAPSSWLPSLAGAVALPIDDEVLMAGGYELGDSSLWPYWGLQSPTDDDLSGSGMSAPPYLASAATMDGGAALMAGGSESESDPAGTTSAEMYEPDLPFSSGTWSTVASMSTARYGAVAASLPNDQVLVAGGEGDSGPLATAEEFSPPSATIGSPPQIDDEAAFNGGPIRVGDMLSIALGSGAEYLAGETESSQWQRCFSTCEDVTASPYDYGDYEVTAADEGATIQMVETLTYAGQSVSAVSNALGPVQPPGFHLIPGTLQGMLPELTNGTLTYLELPVERDDTTGAGEVSYRVWDPTGASYFPAFTPVTGVLSYLPGQEIAEIGVPLTVSGAPILPASLSVQLYDGSPLPVVDPSEATVSIRNPDDSLYVRNPVNPLGLAATPPAGNPLGGAQFFADYYQSLPARTALAWVASYPSLADKVSVIAREPNTQRFGAWNGLDPAWGVSTYLDRAASEEPGTVPMLSTYRVVDGHCGHYSDPPAEQLDYHDWITGLAQGIGTHPAVLFLEMDSLITTGCLSPHGVTVRMNELHDAINVLSNDPHLVVYLDAGAADALPASRAASLLRRAGVAKIQGFFLNSTHFDWTKKEIAYGEKISRLTGGKHFVINTAENGQGPLRPRHPAKQGNEVLCDPPGRGLGPLPTAHTGYRNLDAFAWIANPGVSGGQCRPDAPPSGQFWPALALELVQHEDFKVR
jgi:endoglucanase